MSFQFFEYILENYNLCKGDNVSARTNNAKSVFGMELSRGPSRFTFETQ